MTQDVQLINKRLRIPDKLLIIILAAYPILGEYIWKVLPLTLADLLFFAVFIVGIFPRRYLHFNRRLWLVGLFLAIDNILIGFSYSSISNSIHNSFAIILAFTIMSLIEGNIELDLYYFFRVLAIIGIACTGFMIVQSVLFNQGTIVYGKLSALEKWFVYDNSVCFQSITWGRPSSVFYEPAHYAIFMAPVLLMALYYRKIILSIFFLIGIFLSTSSTGYAIAFAILAIHCFFSLEGKWKVITTTIFVLGALVFLNITDIDYSKFQLSSLSENIRVFGTFSYFKAFELSNFLLGIGFNRLTEWGELNGIATFNYASSFIYMTFSFGIFGLILIIWFIKKIFDRNTFWIPMSLVAVILMASDQLCFNRNFIYLIACMFFMSPIIYEGRFQEKVD